MSLPVVILDLTLPANRFIDVLRTRATTIAARYTLAKFSLGKFGLAVPSPIAEWSAPKLIVHGPARIMVRAKITSAILPVGITFQQVEGSGDPDGTLNFPLSSRILGMNSSHRFLVIDDLHYLHGAPNGFVWKCCVVIQKQDGAIGIIDPHIENQD